MAVLYRRMQRMGMLGVRSAHPAWWLNLRARLEADAQVGRRRFRVWAREATGAEREDLWARFVAIDDAYAEYARRTEGMRVIPVVVLEPTPGA